MAAKPAAVVHFMDHGTDIECGIHRVVSYLEREAKRGKKGR